MTRKVLPNSKVRSNLLSECSRPQANERRERYVAPASARRTLCCGGALNMRERVAKKLLRLPERSLRCLPCGEQHFDRTWEFGETLLVIFNVQS